MKKKNKKKFREIVLKRAIKKWKFKKEHVCTHGIRKGIKIRIWDKKISEQFVKDFKLKLSELIIIRSLVISA